MNEMISKLPDHYKQSESILISIPEYLSFVIYPKENKISLDVIHEDKIMYMGDIIMPNDHLIDTINNLVKDVLTTFNLDKTR